MKFKNFIIYTLLLIFVIFNNFAEAQEIKKASVQKMDLNFEQAYELMLTNNNELKQVLEEVKEKEYRKNAAKGQYFPKIGFQTTYLQFDNPINVGMGPLGVLTLQDKQLWYGAAGAT